MMLSQAERVKEHRKDVPRLHLQLYDRVMSGGRSRKDAIKLQCLECWAFVRKETEACDNFACPLFPLRPYQKKNS